MKIQKWFDELNGLQRFPMRLSSRSKTKGYEQTVELKYHENEYNLFGLSSYPEKYLNEGSYQLDKVKYEFWIEGKSITYESLKNIHSYEILNELISLRLIGTVSEFEDQYESKYRAIPFGNKVFLATHYKVPQSERVYLSNDSLCLAEYICANHPTAQCVLDLCSGSGLLGLLVDSQEHHGYEISEKSYQLAILNAKLNGIEANFYNIGYDDSIKIMQKSDLIIFNPPFIYGPASKGLIDSDGGKYGIEHTLNILKLINQYSNLGTQFLCIGQSPRIEGILKLDEYLSAFTRLSIEIEILDEFEPFAAHSEWYESRKVDSLVQYRLVGSNKGYFELSHINALNDKYCFI